MTIWALPAELEGMRLAQISDIHVGPRVDSQYLIDCFRWVNDDIRPDIIAMAGDFMHCTDSEVVPELEQVLFTLRVPKRGNLLHQGQLRLRRAMGEPGGRRGCKKSIGGIGALCPQKPIPLGGRAADCGVGRFLVRVLFPRRLSTGGGAVDLSRAQSRRGGRPRFTAGGLDIVRPYPRRTMQVWRV